MRTPEQLIADTAPFPEETISKLPPRGDSYVAWSQYNQRMLLHHPDHEYRVISVTHSPGYLVPIKDDAGTKRFDDWRPPVWAVAVELTIEGSAYAAVGEDDSPTSAESNAYKRACAHAGIGLHLYGGYWLHGRLVKGSGDGD